MTTYHLIGKAVCMAFTYDENGQLVKFSTDPALDEKQWQYILTYWPLTEDRLEPFRNNKAFKVEIDHHSPTFSEFWEAYGYKVDKADAEKEWAKLSDEKRALAIRGIKPYDKHLAATMTKKIYACRYLSKRYWENEYK